MVNKIKIKNLAITAKDLSNSLLGLDIYVVLKKSHETCNHFLSVYDTLYKFINKNKGSPKDREQDVLRAMLIFATASLDVILKNLIRKNLKNSIDKYGYSRKCFNNFVRTKIGKKKGEEITVDFDFLSEILSDRDGRKILIDRYIESLITGSLQSFEKVIESSKILGFDITKKETKMRIDIERLKEIFKIRNEIIHQMDVKRDIKGKPLKRTRISRKRDDLVGYTNDIFYIIEFFIFNVNKMYEEKEDSTISK